MDWTDRMRAGDFAGAWEISDAVLRRRAGTPCWQLPRHEQWIWDGSPLAGRRVLIRCYHGLGDTIQFIRYAPMVRALGSHVIVWAPAALLPLLATAEGIDRLIPLHDGTPDVHYDVDVELMELPHVFRTTLATLPARVPYLHVPAAAPREHGSDLQVGIVWAGGDWDATRSVPFSALARLRRVPGVVWHVLQHGPALAQRDPGFGVLADVDGLVPTARSMQALDLVITIDSMPAHLAGALAVPVWTLLPAEADWRWMHGVRTPWYPTMRLFRQPRPGAWEDVVAAVAGELTACVDRRRAAAGTVRAGGAE